MADSGMKAAGYVAAEVMARAGVRHLYTVPGESFLEILDAAEEHPTSPSSRRATSLAPPLWPRRKAS